MREGQLELALHLAPNFVVELADPALSHLRRDIRGDEREEQEHKWRELIPKQDLGVARLDLANDLSGHVVIAQQGVLERAARIVQPSQQRGLQKSRPDPSRPVESVRPTYASGKLLESKVFEIPRQIISRPSADERLWCQELEGVRICHHDGRNPCIYRRRRLHLSGALDGGHHVLQM